MTGREIARVLLEHASRLDSITILEDHMAIDLITRNRLDSRRKRRGLEDACLGAYILDERSGAIETILARNTVLATGGGWQSLPVHIEPGCGDRGRGSRSACWSANRQYGVFSIPPDLFVSSAGEVISDFEALRGEGAILRSESGEAFMASVHERADLAPRDIVARAIDRQMKESGDDCVYLDSTHHEKAFLMERFPTIMQQCLEFGIDPSEQPIPVVPAAHYQCGGLLTDAYGQTTISGLYACGEVACTGLHGANRLASNSLLEALVFSRRAANHALESLSTGAPVDTPEVPAWKRGGMAVDSEESVLVSQCWQEVRQLMWNYVGIVRSDKRLARARKRLELVAAEVREDYWSFHPTRDLIELRNIVDVSLAIVDSAIRRRESRGLHYNVDVPDRDDSNWRHPTHLSR